jgi:hypothetical protein
MGLAVGFWTTVARRTARVATELVGGCFFEGLFADCHELVDRQMQARVH